MALCTPILVGPVSELTTWLLVQGTAAGADVVVSSVGPAPRDVAKQTQVSAGAEIVDLLPGEKLHAGDLLVVAQTLGGDHAQTPHGLELGVQPAPASTADLGPVGFGSHLYSCGEKVFVTGVVPGASVEIEFDGGVKGSDISSLGEAHVSLTEPLPQGRAVSCRQVSSGFAGPPLAVVPDPPPVSDRTAPAPVPYPCMACQDELYVGGVIAGATLIATQTGATHTWVSDGPVAWIEVRELTAGEEVTVRQDLPACEVRGKDSKITAGQTHLPKLIAVPPCAGAMRVDISGIVPGATVQLKVGSRTYAGTPPSDRATFAFGVDPLPASGTVEATQELCGVTSEPVSFPISAHEDVKDPVRITEPLLACGRAVHITNVHAGALVEVFARNQAGVDAPISDQVVAHGSEATIAVAPFLREKDTLTVRQWACSAVPSVSTPPTPVKAHPPPVGPKIDEPIFPGPTVSVEGLPGALIEVELRSGDAWAFAGSAIGIAGPTQVGLTAWLSVGEQVRARQTLCGVRTEPGPAVTVSRPPPRKPILDEPPDFAQNVGLRPTLKWHDGGSGDARADVFRLYLDNAQYPNLTTASWQPPSDLKPSTKYTWAIEARNPSGAYMSDPQVFSTGAGRPPPSPPPHLSGYDFATHRLTGDGFLPNHEVIVRLSMVGSYAENSSGKYVPDTRDVSVSERSDATGKLDVIIVPSNILGLLDLGPIDGYINDAQRGEVLHFSANDGRPASNLTGILWSNTLSPQQP